MEEAKDRLTKENERRSNMAGCEDEFDEDERTVQLIVLRFDDLIAECDLVQVGLLMKPRHWSFVVPLSLDERIVTTCGLGDAGGGKFHPASHRGHAKATV